MDEQEDKHKPADALREMAEGLTDQTDDESPPDGQEHEAADAEQDLWPEQDDAEDSGYELAPPYEDDDIPEAVPASASVSRPSAGPRRAPSHHKLMVPMLLGVAALLLLLSGLTILRLLLDGGAAEGPLQTYGWWLVLVSCPVAAVLILAAWIMHRAGARRGG